MQDAQRDERFISLLEATLLQPAETRDAYLHLACKDDQDLFDELTECMNWHERLGGFLLEPILSIAENDTPFEAGQWIAGRFQIIREIGEGGMGVVYEAFDAKRNQTIAIKAGKIGFRTLLTPELAGALKVRHTNVCLVNEIHTAETPGGKIDFLTMELLEGETLQARLTRDGAIGQDEALAIVRQLCAGLGEAHRSGVIHRDLKTSNVFLSQTADGQLRVVITDFGLAREKPEEAEDLAGTPQYMAPELWCGKAASKASDIYALGVLMYQMVTGRTHDEQSSYGGSLKAPPSNLARGLNRRWDKVILQCLETDPDSRPQSAARVLSRLEKRKLSRIPVVVATLLAVAFLIPGVRRSILQTIWPPANIRLAVLPFSSPPELQIPVNGALENVSDRLRRATNAGSSIAVITPREVRANLIRSPMESGQILHATHALEGVVRREGADLVVDANLTDVQAKTRLKRLSARYPQADFQSMSDALVGTVSRELQLKGTSVREQLSRGAGEWYLRALYFLRRDRRSFDEAIPILQHAKNTDTRSSLPPAAMAEALLMKFQATKERKWLDEARDLLEVAEKLNPDSIHVLVAAGQLDQTMGWYEKALQNYRRIQEIDPRNADAFQGVANVYSAMDLPAKAIEAHLASIRSDPEYYAPYQYFGIYYYFHGQYGEAAEQFRKAIERAPGLVQAYINLGAALSDMGRDGEAEEVLTASLKLKVTASALNSLGAIKTYQKRHLEATRFYERAVDLDGENYIFLFNLADSYRRTARRKDSLRTYRHAMDVASVALKENPRRGYTRAFVGYFAARLGDRRRAEDEISQALRLSPTDQQVIRQSVLTYEVLGERDRTLETLQEASAEMLEELARQPDLGSLREDPRFLQPKKR